MLQDKRKDLDGEKQKALLIKVLNEMSRDRPDLYYQPTSEVARLIREAAQDGDRFNAEERALLQPLSQRDIEVLLSLL